MKPMAPYLAVLAADFYLLPLLIRGTGSAIVIWTVLLIGMITVIQFYGQKKWVNYDV